MIFFLFKENNILIWWYNNRRVRQLGADGLVKSETGRDGEPATATRRFFIWLPFFHNTNILFCACGLFFFFIWHLFFCWLDAKWWRLSKSHQNGDISGHLPMVVSFWVTRTVKRRGRGVSTKRNESNRIYIDDNNKNMDTIWIKKKDENDK